jgi:hypothetical protein
MKVRDTDYDIREYFKRVGDQYPNLTLKDFEKICKSPFTFFRKQIESNNFPTILIKYLGKLIPFRDYKEKQNEEARKAFEKPPKAKRYIRICDRELPVLDMVPQEPKIETSVNPSTHSTADNTQDNRVDG